MILNKIHSSLCIKTLIILFILLNFSQLSAAEKFKDEQVKVALVYNFINHITWPNENLKNTFTIGIYNDPSLFKIFYLSFENSTRKGKKIQILNVHSIDEAKTADVVYFSKKYNQEFSTSANNIRSSATLVISEESTERQDIMINLTRDAQNTTFSFEVNKSNIIYEKLAMSKDILLLGGTELDVATIYRETEAAMLKTKKREVALNQKLYLQEQRLSGTTQKIQQMNQELKTKSQQLLTHRRELDRVNNKLGNQKKIISNNEQSLLAAAEQLNTIEQSLKKEKQAIEIEKRAHQSVIKQIETSKVILKEHQLNLAEKTELLNQKNLALIEHGQTIDTQKRTIIIVSILIIIAIAVTLLVIILFVKNKNTTRKLSHALKNLEISQNQLVESQKMAALGSLVAGVAHEINTPIGICVTASSHFNESVSFLDQKFQENTMTKNTLRKFIDESSQLSILIQNNLNKAAELILSFKRVSVEQSSEQLHNLRIKETLLDIVTSSKPKFKHYDVEFIINCPDDTVLKSYPGIVAQIISNFINNSFEHAFDENVSGGVINITVTPTENNYLLRFQDNGKGISPENLPKILEPFFTTNREYGGSGLGLNIVYNLIRNKLDSEVNYDSIIGEGTWFELTLKNLAE